MARPINIIELTTEGLQELHRRVQASTTTRRDHLRARIILLRAGKMRQQDVVEALSVRVVCLNKWSQRVEREGWKRFGTNGDDDFLNEAVEYRDVLFDYRRLNLLRRTPCRSPGLRGSWR